MKGEKLLVIGSRYIDVISVLTGEFHNVICCSENECMEYIGENPALAVLFEQNFEDTSNLILNIKSALPKVQIIIITRKADTGTIVDFMRLGAYDIFSIPFDLDRFLMSAVHATERSMLIETLESFMGRGGVAKIKTPDAFKHIVTKSQAMLSIFSYLEEIALSKHPVLINGETGVGKELVAQAVYKLSGLNPYVAVNIAGIDDSIFSDTLFGHKKGAFTSADTNREGLLSKVINGVLLLDEIGELSEQSQIKLLRLIQENCFYPLGVDTPVMIQTKLILATNKNLEVEVASGRFRRDLYYRIKTHSVNIPPLRERMEDIPLLMLHFVEKAAVGLGRAAPAVTAEILSLLNTYTFPGNVRELESMVNDAIAVHKGGPFSPRIFLKHIRDAQGGFNGVKSETAELDGNFERFPTLKEYVDYLVDKALERTGGNQAQAARLLGITRQALNKRLVNRRID
jgi:DNA-binding NtrC family response regulator